MPNRVVTESKVHMPLKTVISMHLIQLTVDQPVRASSFTPQLDSSFQRVGRSLAGGDPHTIAKNVLTEPYVRQHVLNRVVQEIDNECMSVCCWQPVSVFRKITPFEIENYS